MSYRTGGKHEACRKPFFLWMNGGAGRDRTDDILLAKQALSQLSYGPFFLASSAGGDIRRLGSRAIRRDARRGSRMHRIRYAKPWKVVGLGGLEPPTSRLSSARSNQLSYKP